VSTDKTYGYAQDNPIRLGGGAFGGSARLAGYLEALRSPQGQAITYERLGSTPHGEAILDTVIVSYAGLAVPITLYFDVYSYSHLEAPLGFTCGGPFILPEP
jgi:hypothetical protein